MSSGAGAPPPPPVPSAPHPPPEPVEVHLTSPLGMAGAAPSPSRDDTDPTIADAARREIDAAAAAASAAAPASAAIATTTITTATATATATTTAATTTADPTAIAITTTATATVDVYKLIAFVNPGSGGQRGAKVLTVLRGILGDAAVFDIKADGGPGRGLDAVSGGALAGGEGNSGSGGNGGNGGDGGCARALTPVRAFVAGGDGTFSWVASVVESRGLSHVALAPIPLGSGNDISRALGWGIKYPGAAALPTLVEYLRGRGVVRERLLDVWRVSVTGTASVASSTSIDVDGASHTARPVMVNYISFGVDAAVELAFNEKRWRHPERYKTRGGNLTAHLTLGARHVLVGSKFTTADFLESVTVDGVEVSVPPRTQSLIVLNIPSYGGGTQPWGFPTPRASRRHGHTPMSVDDGRFEVLALPNLTHYTLMRLRVPAMRLAQGRVAEVRLREGVRTPAQVDGEPWAQHGGVVTIRAGTGGQEGGNEGRTGGQVAAVPGPRWHERRRANAKFSIT
ncbi:hypothetical protein I4F81_004946 [Pyropia yezoensis]|uniref:Uncharacterized protein n=1 Tax=Pyropia yezoensis TaxID=2788 RepID=A0ACC3BWV5_PYRYE|nr:hypothetical protein I4F81_004946 [Neopyropia yezoensis]